jgi:PKD repeat protein
MSLRGVDISRSWHGTTCPPNRLPSPCRSINDMTSFPNAMRFVRPRPRPQPHSELPGLLSSGPRGVLFSLALGFIVLAGIPFLGIGAAGASHTPRPSATSVTISEVGAGPTTVSLAWTESGDVLFVSYTLQYSTAGSNGPWTSFPAIDSIGATSEYIYGQTPGATYWWQIIDTDDFGSATSNTLQFTQPNVAHLSYTLPTATSAQLSWTNDATYAGYVAFGSYSVLESVNGGSAASVSTISSVSTMSYTINGLSPSTSYSFYVTTTDECTGCSGGSYTSPSQSNAVSFNTPSPVSASASATPSSVDVGQTVSFSCTAGGGVAPYTYSWVFGDGTTGTGQSATHSYTTAGSMTAVCTVRDSDSTTATGAASVAVVALPSVTTPSASPNGPLEGSSVTITVSASGGSGGLTYTWAGLPPGCVSANSPSVTCTPTSSGTYQVSVTVVDSNGGQVTSQALSLTVSASFLGQPQAQGFEILSAGLGLVIVVIVVVVAVLVLRRRRRPGNPPQPYQGPSNSAGVPPPPT